VDGRTGGDWFAGERELVLPVEELEKNLVLARKGNHRAREELIETCRPLVARVAAGLCRRRLEWGYDDELSVGLIALDEAIDRYEEDRRVPFPAFARLIIRSRITDYLRREGRRSAYQAASLEVVQEETGVSKAEADLAQQEYLAREMARERKEEIQDFALLLADFKISFAELVGCAPRHRDARAGLLRVARVLAEHEELFNQLMQRKKLPVQELSRVSGVNRKTLERGRRYIIAMALLWHYCPEYVYLCHYLKDAFRGGNTNAGG